MNNSVDRARFLMSYDNKTTLNENFQLFEEAQSAVITDWLSPDEKFVIFLDELYDLTNKTKIGNIWENFDHFKFFLKHSFEVSKNVPQHIKESVLNSLNNQLLIESKTNYSTLKPLFKQFLTERTWAEWGAETAKDFGKWAYQKGKETVKGVSDFASTTFKGAQKLVGNISRGEWDEVLNILGKGTLYVARRLRDAMYHPVGIILDGILVASGIGKSVQWIPWAIIVALDIYEITTGDVESPTELWQQFLFLGIDILGLVFAGGVAKATKALFGGAKTSAQASEILARNPEIATQMIQATEKTPGLLAQAASFLSKKFPKGAEFINGILGYIGSFMTKLVDTVKSLIKPKSTTGKVAQSVAGRSALTYGIEKGVQSLAGTDKPSEEEKIAKNDDDFFSAGEAEYDLNF